MPFVDICWYFGWIICIIETMCRHLTKRVKRQYERVQKIPRHPCSVDPLERPHIVQAFRDFMIHVMSLAERCVGIMDSWRTIRRYMTWFCRVSQLVMTAPVEVVKLPPPRPHNKEVIIEEKYAR